MEYAYCKDSTVESGLIIKNYVTRTSMMSSTTSALEAPVTTNCAALEAFRMGYVKVILCGGGFGESAMEATSFSFSWSYAVEK